MRLDAFDYDLPPDRIAQEPARERDGSRLMMLDRASGKIDHGLFRDLPALLHPGDLLVLNDSGVIPARLLARKPGGSLAEVLFLERLEDEGPPLQAGSNAEGGSGEEALTGESWRALVRGWPRGGGQDLELPGGLKVRLLGREADGELARVRVSPRGGVEAALERSGLPPLPPYIRREPGDPRLEEDRLRYQTVYAAHPGAVAAPTAGLHFTQSLLGRIRERGVGIGTLTLHVGWGTFQPVRVERIEDHRMHAERFTITRALVEAIASTRRAGGRVVAVGTTVVRALEHAAAGVPRGDPSRAQALDATAARAGLMPGTGLCDLFIRPGHAFRIVDALVTNFHLPRSTLLVLVCAFAGRDRILSAYAEAVRRGYRFYSYGDAMVIL